MHFPPYWRTLLRSPDRNLPNVGERRILLWTGKFSRTKHEAPWFWDNDGTECHWVGTASRYTFYHAPDHSDLWFKVTVLAYLDVAIANWPCGYRQVPLAVCEDRTGRMITGTTLRWEELILLACSDMLIQQRFFRKLTIPSLVPLTFLWSSKSPTRSLPAI